MDQGVLDQIREKTQALLAQKGVELVDLLFARESGRFILRFLVDKAGGITLDECAQLNQEIGRLLDAEDVVQQSYVLEVASPGLDRPLKSTSDFQRHLGHLIRVVLHQPLCGQKVWIGELDAVDDQKIIIQSKDQQRLEISRHNIARARAEVYP